MCPSMEKKKPKEQPWVLMAWISFLAVIITAPMIVHEESWVYRGAMGGALLAILAWSAWLLHSSLKEARAAQPVDEESDTAPVGTGGTVGYTPLAAGALIGACALAVALIAMVPHMAQIMWMVLASVGVGVAVISLVYRHVTRKQEPETEYDPAAEQVRSAEVPEEEEK